MIGSPLENKAHELLGQLAPTQLAAVVQLLEVMIHDDEQLSHEDRIAVSSSREYFQKGGNGLSFEQMAAECGFNMDQIRDAQPE